MNKKVSEFNSYSPKEISQLVVSIGVYKSQLSFLPLALLGMLAGSFIALGAHYSTIVSSDPSISFGISRILSGICFSLGLFLVVIAGAELFTGNILITMAWVDKRITYQQLLRNWVIVGLANAIGAAGIAVLIFFSASWHLNHDAIGFAYLNIAAVKSTHSIWQDIFLGILCNNLVCLAIWMSFAGKTVIDKFIAIVFPISSFSAAGFEHSVANIYFYIIAILLKTSGTIFFSNSDLVSFYFMFKNLLPVVIGNILGGSVLVAFVYWAIYRRNIKSDKLRGDVRNPHPKE